MPVPPGLSDGRGHGAGRRFDVYRNNVAVALTEALEAGFPAVRSLVGPENFRKAASVFARQSPPDTPVLMVYGAGFPRFLEGFTPLAHLGYLADVARLDQAMREAYHAADATPMPSSALEAQDPACLARACVELSPALRLVRSAWPVHAIWRFATEDSAPKPAAKAEDVLITRPEFDPVAHVLPSGGASFLTALRSGRTLQDAADQAVEATPEFDLAAMLGLLLQGAAITALHRKERS